MYLPRHRSVDDMYVSVDYLSSKIELKDYSSISIYDKTVWFKLTPPCVYANHRLNQQFIKYKIFVIMNYNKSIEVLKNLLGLNNSDLHNFIDKSHLDSNISKIINRGKGNSYSDYMMATDSFGQEKLCNGSSNPTNSIVRMLVGASKKCDSLNGESFTAAKKNRIMYKKMNDDKGRDVYTRRIRGEAGGTGILSLFHPQSSLVRSMAADGVLIYTNQEHDPVSLVATGFDGVPRRVPVLPGESITDGEQKYIVFPKKDEPFTANADEDLSPLIMPYIPLREGLLFCKLESMAVETSIVDTGDGSVVDGFLLKGIRAKSIPVYTIDSNGEIVEA